MSSEKNRFIYFFGAGASVKAGVNTTFGLVDEFKEHVKTKQQLRTLLFEILGVLEKNSHLVDIEELLQTIEQLESREKENLLKFYDPKIFLLKNANDLKQLKEELKIFINKTTTVKQENVHYLSPLFSYGKPLKIFSVNYDIAWNNYATFLKKRTLTVLITRGTHNYSTTKCWISICINCMVLSCGIEATREIT